MYKNYPFYVKPITKQLQDGVEVTTWKYDNDQRHFNFQYKVRLDIAGNNFAFEEGALFNGNMDLIEAIGSVEIKDGYLIIEGLKEKGNE